MREHFVRAGRPTELGRKAQQLVLADHQLQQLANPEVDFAMSSLQEAKAKVTRETLLVDFGIKEDEAEQHIRKIKRKLDKGGIPFTRTGHLLE